MQIHEYTIHENFKNSKALRVHACSSFAASLSRHSSVEQPLRVNKKKLTKLVKS